MLNKFDRLNKQYFAITDNGKLEHIGEHSSEADAKDYAEQHFGKKWYILADWNAVNQWRVTAVKAYNLTLEKVSLDFQKECNEVQNAIENQAT